ncbi:MAG: hypothetical protein PHE53_00280 [Thermoguttaceae bacterium]|nr:hypothetical protein [Thermoguttaceae bacterium]
MDKVRGGERKATSTKASAEAPPLSDAIVVQITITSGTLPRGDGVPFRVTVIRKPPLVVYHPAE